MTVRMVKMADEAFATGNMPAGYRAMAGYLNSRGALHPWSRSDWAKFGKRKKLPIFVPGSSLDDPFGDAFNVLRQLWTLGVPKGSPVALDMETRVSYYVRDFCNVLAWAGYRVWVYGSASTVFGNPCPRGGGYWVADYAGRGPFMFSHRNVVATQYANGKGLDSSVMPWLTFRRVLKRW